MIACVEMQFRQGLWWFWTPSPDARIDGVCFSRNREVYVFARNDRRSLEGTKFGGVWLSYRCDPKAPTRYLTPREALAALRGEV